VLPGRFREVYQKPLCPHSTGDDRLSLTDDGIVGTIDDRGKQANGLIGFKTQSGQLL
jgi:hypothetical protein